MIDFMRRWGFWGVFVMAAWPNAGAHSAPPPPLFSTLRFSNSRTLILFTSFLVTRTLPSQKGIVCELAYPRELCCTDTNQSIRKKLEERFDEGPAKRFPTCPNSRLITCASNIAVVQSCCPMRMLPLRL